MERSPEVERSFWNLSNKLTLFRIGAIPGIAVLLQWPGKVCSFFAALLFLLAAISDSLDGYLARKRGTVTVIGKLIDPLADKLLVLISLIFLIPLGRVAPWIVALIIAREMAVTTLRAVAASQGVIIAASPLGKAKSFLQLASTNLLILHYPYFSLNIHLIGYYLIYGALVVTLISGAHYFLRYLRRDH